MRSCGAWGIGYGVGEGEGEGESESEGEGEGEGEGEDECVLQGASEVQGEGNLDAGYVCAIQEEGHGIAIAEVLAEGMGELRLHLSGLGIWLGSKRVFSQVKVGAPLVVDARKDFENPHGPFVCGVSSGAQWSRPRVLDERRDGTCVRVMYDG